MHTQLGVCIVRQAWHPIRMPPFSAVIGNLHPGAVLQRFEGGMGANETPHPTESSQDPLFFERVLFFISGQMQVPPWEN